MTGAHPKPEWAQSRFEKQNAERVAQGLKPRRRIWRWLVLGLVVVGGVAFFVLQPPPAQIETTEDNAEVVRQLLPGEIIEIAPMRLQQTVKVTGTLEPAHQSAVASQASGRVLSVTVRPGDSVEEGAILAEIDRATLELQLNQQKATADATRIQLSTARQQLERTEELARQGLASPATLEQSRSSSAALEANLAALESGVASAEIALSNATVRAPLTGIVSARSVEPGQTVSAGTPLFTIVNLDEVEFQASASVNSSALVKSGQAAVVAVTGVEGREFAGEVTRVNPVAISGTRAVPIYIALDNVEALLRGGMFATGHITVSEKAGAIAVPAGAIREDAEGTFVLALSEGRLERRPVTAGREWDRGRIVEITGVSTGETVVASQLSGLSAGDAYEILGN